MYLKINYYINLHLNSMASIDKNNMHEKSSHTYTDLKRMTKEELIKLFRQVETSALDLGALHIVDNLEQDIAVFEAEEFKYKETINILNETNEKLTKRIKFLDNQYETLKEKFNKQKAFYSEPQQDEINKLNAEIDKTIEKLSVTTQELERVRDQDFTWKLCRANAENTIKSISDKNDEEIERMGLVIERQKKDKSSLITECNEVMEENNKLKDLFERTSKAVGTLSADFTCIIHNLN